MPAPDGPLVLEKEARKAFPTLREGDMMMMYFTRCWIPSRQEEGGARGKTRSRDAVQGPCFIFRHSCIWNRTTNSKLPLDHQQLLPQVFVERTGMIWYW